MNSQCGLRLNSGDACALSGGLEKRFQVFQMRIFRWTLNIPWTAPMTNEEFLTNKKCQRELKFLIEVENWNIWATLWGTKQYIDFFKIISREKENFEIRKIFRYYRNWIERYQDKWSPSMLVEANRDIPRVKSRRKPYYYNF